MKLCFSLTIDSEKINLEERFMAAINGTKGYDTEIISALAKILALSMKLTSEDQVSIVAFNVTKVDQSNEQIQDDIKKRIDEMNAPVPEVNNG